MPIRTASWFATLPADHVKIGISRGVPRNERPGYRRLRALEPGPWFNSVAPDEYLRRYDRILERLEPRIVAADLRDLAGAGKVAVMVCFESAAQIEAGTTWCHRHLVAQWLEGRLGIEVPGSAMRSGRSTASPSCVRKVSSHRPTAEGIGPDAGRPCLGSGRRDGGEAAKLAAGAIQLPLLALGVASVVRSSPLAFDLLRWAGAVYLVWLGAGLLLRRGANTVPAGAATPSRSPSAWAALREASLPISPTRTRSCLCWRSYRSSSIPRADR